MAANARSWSANRDTELFVTNSTRRPEARSRSIASGAPGIAWRASHTTPSRSHSTNSIRSKTSRSVASRAVHADRLYQVGASGTLSRAPLRTVPRSPVRVGSLDDVIAPPYDVLSDAQVDELEARHAHNIVHVDVPRERDGDDRYAAAGDLLRTWLGEGVMARDDDPSFTLYRMSFTDAAGRDREIVGVLGALEVVDEGAGDVLPHERVTPKASTDRLDLTRATEANMSPIWGLSLAHGPHEPAHRAGRAGRVGDRRRGHPHRRTGHRGRARGRHQRHGVVRRRPDRRRPSPLRRRTPLPRRGARRTTRRDG